MTLPQPSGLFTQEEALDMLAYILATNSLTSNIQWILGDVGMGAPSAVPFGYISPFNETVLWMTASGGTGGGGGTTGIDDFVIPIVITIAFTPHEYFPPVAAAPPSSGPFKALEPLPYFEQPSFRTAVQIKEAVTAVLRTNITVGGEVTTTRIMESRYLLQAIQGQQYRVCRMTVQAQQRRKRGN